MFGRQGSKDTRAICRRFFLSIICATAATALNSVFVFVLVARLLLLSDGLRGFVLFRYFFVSIISPPRSRSSTAILR